MSKKINKRLDDSEAFGSSRLVCAESVENYWKQSIKVQRERADALASQTKIPHCRLDIEMEVTPGCLEDFKPSVCPAIKLNHADNWSALWQAVLSEDAKFCKYWFEQAGKGTVCMQPHTLCDRMFIYLSQKKNADVARRDSFSPKPFATIGKCDRTCFPH